MTHSVRAILERLRAPGENIIAQARRRVEAYVPEARRGPGWDRHWRELEAYLELPGRWSGERTATVIPLETDDDKNDG